MKTVLATRSIEIPEGGTYSLCDDKVALDSSLCVSPFYGSASPLSCFVVAKDSV